MAALIFKSESVYDEKKQAEGDDGYWQSQNHKDRPNKGVDQSDNQ